MTELNTHSLTAGFVTSHISAMCTPVVGNRENLVLIVTVEFYWRKPFFLVKSIKFIFPKLPWLLMWFQRAHLCRTTEESQEVDAVPLRLVLPI